MSEWDAVGIVLWALFVLALVALAERECVDIATSRPLKKGVS